MTDDPRLAARPQQPPIFDHLGGHVIGRDEASGRWRIGYLGRPEFSNGHGVQGGMIAAMLDNCMALAFILENRGQGRFRLPTLEMKVSFLRPAPLGPLEGQGWITRQGRSITFLEAHLLDPQGRLLATASSTIMPAVQEG